MTRTHPLVTLAALLAALVALAACETAPDDVVVEEPTPTPAATPDVDTPEAEADDEALERIADAAANTVEEGTARFSIALETEDTPGAEGRQPLAAEGEEDFTEQRRRLTFEGPQGQLEMLIDRSDVYIQLPATEDDDWLRVQLDALLDEDVGFGGPGGLPFQSPRNNLEILRQAATSATEAGEDDVDGEDTTRYEVTLDLEATAAEAEEDVRATLEETVSRTGVDQLDATVWVDEQDRIRRITYTLDLGQVDVEAEVQTDTPEAEDVEVEARGTVTVTIDYHAFGVPVDVELPDPDQVIDLDEEELRETFGTRQSS
jgi:hypothetical protein